MSGGNNTRTVNPEVWRWMEEASGDKLSRMQTETHHIQDQIQRLEVALLALRKSKDNCEIASARNALEAQEDSLIKQLQQLRVLHSDNAKLVLDLGQQIAHFRKMVGTARQQWEELEQAVKEANTLAKDLGKDVVFEPKLHCSVSSSTFRDENHGLAAVASVSPLILVSDSQELEPAVWLPQEFLERLKQMKQHQKSKAANPRFRVTKDKDPFHSLQTHVIIGVARLWLTTITCLVNVLDTVSVEPMPVAAPSLKCSISLKILLADNKGNPNENIYRNHTSLENLPENQLDLLLIVEGCSMLDDAVYSGVFVRFHFPTEAVPSQTRACTSRTKTPTFNFKQHITIHNASSFASILKRSPLLFEIWATTNRTGPKSRLEQDHDSIKSSYTKNLESRLQHAESSATRARSEAISVQKQSIELGNTVNVKQHNLQRLQRQVEEDIRTITELQTRLVDAQAQLTRERYEQQEMRIALQMRITDLEKDNKHLRRLMGDNGVLPPRRGKSLGVQGEKSKLATSSATTITTPSMNRVPSNPVPDAATIQKKTRSDSNMRNHVSGGTITPRTGAGISITNSVGISRNGSSGPAKNIPPVDLKALHATMSRGFARVTAASSSRSRVSSQGGTSPRIFATISSISPAARPRASSTSTSTPIPMPTHAHTHNHTKQSAEATTNTSSLSRTIVSLNPTSASASATTSSIPTSTSNRKSLEPATALATTAVRNVPGLMLRLGSNNGDQDNNGATSNSNTPRVVRSMSPSLSPRPSQSVSGPSSPRLRTISLGKN